jgi:hypothetical protein
MPENSPAEAGSGDKPSKLSLARGQEASLGCGTLVLITVIVLYCSGTGTGDLKRDVHGLRSEVGELKKAVEAQATEIQQLRERLPAPAKVADGKGKE